MDGPGTTDSSNPGGMKSCRMRRLLRYQAIRFFRIQGSNEKAARGFAIGLTCNFFPTFGLGGFLSGFLAKLAGGNMATGFFGGCLLAFFWPVLFYINIRVGSLFVRPPILVDELCDVTPQAVGALVWGKTFAIGAIVNSLVASAAAYFLFLFAYERIRPVVLRRLRRGIRLRQGCARRVRAPGARSR